MIGETAVGVLVRKLLNSILAYALEYAENSNSTG
jgi:hypothetical protein